MARPFLLFIALLAVFPGVLALGISQEYHENQTIFLEQGETYVHHITIQNDLPVAIPIRFTITGKYATVNGAQEMTLSLPEKSVNTVVPITITIPEDAPTNTTESVQYAVQPVVEGTGTVNMAVRLTDSFSIVVRPKPRPWWPPYAIGAGALLALCIVFFVGMRWASRPRRVHTSTTSSIPKEPKRASRHEAHVHHDLIVSVAEMDDKTLASELRSGRIAHAVFGQTNDPELYHRVKVARDRKELLRVLRGER